ncbi:MAG: metallophosphoesterase, partial [Polaromonas sp.]|nr:metallophosphoesterase [Polaromonas sp.]
MPTMAQALLEAGANPNVADVNGDTPLLVACDRSLVPVAIQLIKLDTIEIGPNRAGITPEQVCFKKGLTSVTEELTKKIVVVKRDEEVNPPPPINTASVGPNPTEAPEATAECPLPSAGKITSAEYEAISTSTEGDGKSINKYNPTKQVGGCEIGTTIHGKLLAAKTKWKTEQHTIDIAKAKYEKVYITSDIHADVRKFLQMLAKEMLITVPESFDFYSTDAATDPIYTFTVIDTIHWNPANKNTLLVIVGDLVDGKRGRVSVNDTTGRFELLLHILLFNLRIEATQVMSEILFTIGNHDYHSVLKNNGLFDYIHMSANIFFGDLRQAALTPFYELSPYLAIQLKNGERVEILCIHAGLHDGTSATKGLTIFKNVIDAQAKIVEKGLVPWINTMDNSSPQYLWSRMYSDVGLDTGSMSWFGPIIDNMPIETVCSKINETQIDM